VSEIVERAARAICRTTFEGLSEPELDAQVEGCWYVWEDAARAVLDAMRPMLGAAREELTTAAETLSEAGYFRRSEDATRVATMIDAALKEEP
jgi:hypothetical protein